MNLKEIAPYLAYEIKFTRITDNPNYRPTETLNCDNIKHWEDGRAKYHMHPLSDLTRPCLEDGKVPIVELAKMAYENICHINENFDSIALLSEGDSYGIIGFYSKERVALTFDKELSWNEFALSIDSSKMMLNQLLLFNWLYEHHFWLGDQSRFEQDIIDINTLK